MTPEMLFASSLVRKDVASPLHDVYETIDLPLVPVLLRMEQVGVRVDSDVLRALSNRLSVDIDNLAERVYAMAGETMGIGGPHRFNINSPKQLGDVLFNKMLLPKPMKYGKGKVVSTAQDVLEELAEHHAAPALVLEYRQMSKLRSNYTDQLPTLADAEGRVHTTFNQVGDGDGKALVDEPEPAEYSDSDGSGAGDSDGVYTGAGEPVDVSGLLADRTAVDGAFFAGPAAAECLQDRPGYPYVDGGGGVWG